MLIQRNHSYYATVPVKLFLYSKEAGFVMVGDDYTRILLNKEEIEQFYKLLQPFIRPDQTVLSKGA